MKTVHVAVTLVLLFAASLLGAQQSSPKLNSAELAKISKALGKFNVPIHSTIEPSQNSGSANTTNSLPQSVPAGTRWVLNLTKKAKILNLKGKVDTTVELRVSSQLPQSRVGKLPLPEQVNLMVHHLSENKILKIKTGPPSDMAKQKEYFLLPEVYEARSSKGSQVSLRPAFFVLKSMCFDHKRDLFEGVLNVFLIDEEHPSDNLKLVQPVTVHVRATDAQSIPNTLSISHANLPDTSINFVMQSPMDSVKVLLLTSDNRDGYEVNIPVSPAIRLDFPKHPLQGFGIEQIEVAVSLIGVSTGKPVTVGLVATNGIVNPTAIELKPGEIKKVFFRSQRSGQGVLDVQAPGMAPGKYEISYVLPWIFILSFLLGVLLGAWINFVRQPQGTPDKGKKTFWHYLKTGLPFALLLALLYALGINPISYIFPTYSHFSEIITLAFSALIVGGGISVRIKK
ncbi:MAG: hypothetical protein JNJ90_18190 [Saprospiraceae bacterium]|jgi:hypothetical protein|nr:hypothetical protein [Saprospiraceae bacterium]